MRYCLPLSALVLLGCSSKPLDMEQARKNLKDQAEAVGRAMLQEDHQKMADLTLPALVEKFGGREKFVQKLESMAGELKGDGMRFDKFVISGPSELAEAAGDVYGIVPFTLEMTGPNGMVGSKPSYLIAVSRDRGASWKFLDGAGVAGDRTRLKTILPNLPSNLRLPEKRPAVWKKK